MSKKLQRQLAGLSKEKLYRLAESHYNGQVRATRALIAVLANLGGVEPEYITRETLDGIPAGASYALEDADEGWTVRLVLPEVPAAEPNIHGIGPDTDGGPNPDYVPEEALDEAGVCDIEANG